jgi:hypothetical protein
LIASRQLWRNDGVNIAGSLARPIDGHAAGPVQSEPYSLIFAALQLAPFRTISMREEGGTPQAIFNATAHSAFAGFTSLEKWQSNLLELCPINTKCR